MLLPDVLKMYKELREDLAKFEDGTWREDKILNRLSIEQIERLKKAVEQAEAMGLHLLTEIKN